MALRPSQVRQIDTALKGLEPKIQKAFMEAIRTSAAQVNIDELIKLLEIGDAMAALEMLQLEPANLFKMTEAIRDAYITGGPLVAGATIAFDGRALRAEAWARKYVGDFVEGITQTTSEALRTVIVDGLTAGRNPRSLAVDIVGRREGSRRVGGFLGLTQGQAASISRGRGLLSSGIPSEMEKYLELKLRDKGYDRLIRKAIRDSKPITGKTLDKLLESHKSKALRHRAEVIARTEAMNALRAGRREGLAQMVDAGKITDEQVKRVWDATLDERTRPLHIDMDEQVVYGMNEMFVTPDGYFMLFPGDTSLGAPGHHTIQCRCIERYEIDYLGVGFERDTA